MSQNSEKDKGLIAQLEERLPCKQDAGGSIPPGASNEELIVPSFEFFERLKLLRSLDPESCKDQDLEWEILWKKAYRKFPS